MHVGQVWDPVLPFPAISVFPAGNDITDPKAQRASCVSFRLLSLLLPQLLRDLSAERFPSLANIHPGSRSATDLRVGRALCAGSALMDGQIRVGFKEDPRLQEEQESQLRKSIEIEMSIETRSAHFMRFQSGLVLKWKTVCLYVHVEGADVVKSYAVCTNKTGKAGLVWLLRGPAGGAVCFPFGLTFWKSGGGGGRFVSACAGHERARARTHARTHTLQIFLSYHGHPSQGPLLKVDHISEVSPLPP